MQRTHAEFKLERESIGCPQQYFADLMDVNVRSVKAWERPDGPHIPDDAWNLLEHLRVEHQVGVGETLKQVSEIESSIGNAPQHITIMYYRDKKQFAERHPVEDPDGWQLANAKIREVVSILRAQGKTVYVTYPPSEEE